MVMNTKLIKSAFLEIKSRKKIFISILFMAFLGVGFFSGIKATAPSMKNTIESYFNDNNTFDIEIMSSNMINNTLIEDIKEIDGINDIEPVISVDKISLYNDKKPVVKIFSLPNKINKLKLVEGRLTINDDECVIDAAIKKSNENFSIGDYIEIEDSENLLKNKRLKIVG